jgi:DNA-binding MarR family transcriptional regulator
VARELPSAELIRRCIELGLRLRQVLAVDLAPYGVTPEQHELLGFVAMGLTSAGQIVEASGRDKTTLSRAIARAVRAGWLRCERSSGDRRRQVLRLTDEGAGIVEHTSHLLTRAAPRLLVALTPKERRRLGKLVRKLHRGLSAT